MGYMVAILLIQMDKADAFTVMRHILTSPPYEMMDFFNKEMKGLKMMRTSKMMTGMLKWC